MRRIKKSDLKNKKDFYQTNPYMVKALRFWLTENGFNENLSFLDPCTGKGVICRGLYEKFVNIKKFDKFMGNIRINFLTHTKKYDVVVMNPPYSAKYKFIDHARKHSNIVICLLPLNISNYNMFHRQYEDIPEFVGKIQMAPKMFLDETTTFKAGGTAQYCWYIWDKNNNTDYSKTWYYDLREYIK